VNVQLAPFLPLIQQMTVDEHLIGRRILNEIRARGIWNWHRRLKR